MKTVGDILEAVWNLPWYKVLVVAVADDAILFLKIWWLWLAFMVVAIVIIIIER